MDLTRYWAVIRDHWILFLIGVILTTSLAAGVAFSQPDVYEASGTFVVRPRVIQGTEVVRAIDTLNRSVEIGSTYAFIARSDVIEDRARERLGGDLSGLSVHADLVAGTNVIEITVTGGDPEAVAVLAVGVGEETVAYIASLLDAFELAPLDSAEVPNNPVGPNRRLTIAFGLIFGVGIGALLAMLAQLAREWKERPSRSDVTDPYTGVYSEQYFNARFRQEVLRAKRRRRSFSLGMLRVVVDHRTHEAVPTKAVLRQVALILQGKVDDDDVLAYLGDGVFAVILEDYDTSRAEWQLKQWQKEMEATEFTDAGFPVSLRMSVGVGSYGHEDAAAPDSDELVSGLL